VTAVPVFWVAAEDHDFDEISSAHVLGRAGELVDLNYKTGNGAIGKSVADIELEAGIADTIGTLFSTLSTTEFTDALRKTIETCWVSGETMSGAFGRYLASVFGRYGLIILSPVDRKLKQAASPIYAEAIRLSSDINSALRARSGRLEEAGYHAQVRVDEGYFPLFWHDDDGLRQALKITPKGLIRSKNGAFEFSVNEFADLALREPQRLSPGVMFRSVVQDYLLPTACYFGGGAEIAYFAQNSETYRILGRRVTPIIHRQSFTVIEPKHSRTIERFGLEFKDLFRGQEELSRTIVEKFLKPETAMLFADVEERINTQLNRLDHEFSQMDVTLAENLAKRRRKIIYHLGALRKKFHRAQILKDETARRQIENMFTALLPHGQLQERVLNLSNFADRYGPNFVDWMYSACDLDDNGHRIVFL
jgi:bacillithiol biosynthesis cysteine-adding enzyme BshC